VNLNPAQLSVNAVLGGPTAITPAISPMTVSPLVTTPIATDP
jgi:hypothetical protein